MIRGMVNVIRGKACLMSKTTPRALGCLPEDFPEVGRFFHPKSNSVTAHSVGGEDNHVDQEPLRQAEGECDPNPDAPPPAGALGDSSKNHQVSYLCQPLPVICNAGGGGLDEELFCSKCFQWMQTTKYAQGCVTTDENFHETRCNSSVCEETSSSSPPLEKRGSRWYQGRYSKGSS